MKLFKHIVFIFFLASNLNLQAQETLVESPMLIDDRIKTFIYDENRVFLMLIDCGYSSTIEFAKGETVSTISLGDTYSWKISPIGRRIFIKAFQEDINTNMTVITNKRTYHFDLVSRSADNRALDKNLVYVARFFYPEEEKSKGMMIEDSEAYNE